jgi:hypothetical protein
MHFARWLVLLACCTSAEAISQSLEAPYMPTRAEWLELSVERHVRRSTEAWAHRVVPIVAVRSAEGAVVVIVTAANGQPPAKKEVADEYVKTARSRAQQVLQMHDWSRSLKLDVQWVQ